MSSPRSRLLKSWMFPASAAIAPSGRAGSEDLLAFTYHGQVGSSEGAAGPSRAASPATTHFTVRFIPVSTSRERPGLRASPAAELASEHRVVIPQRGPLSRLRE